MTQLSAANLDKAFALLVECAVKGERCPITSGPDAHPWLRSQQVCRLASEKRIAVSIGHKNWRRVKILVGEHAGKMTSANPVAGGAQRFYGHSPAGSRKPSAPRLLTREELSR
jgi:hypothetical protein